MATKKYKRMTLKEFKAALETEAKMTFDVWGWDGILNCLAVLASFEAKENRSLGLSALERTEDEKCTNIHRYLKERGYYDRRN